MRIGITGHQNFENQSWVEATMNDEFDNMKIERGFSSLAVGADQLFVRQLAQRAVPYTVIVPSAHYESTFESAPDLAEYRRLLNEADSIVELDNNTPSERAFYDAGLAVVDASDLVVAVWNGKPAKGLGGTADIVEYARSVAKPVVHLNPDQKEKLYYGSK